MGRSVLLVVLRTVALLNAAGEALERPFGLPGER